MSVARGEVVQSPITCPTSVQPAICHQVQSAIRQEKVQFEEPMQTTKIDYHEAQVSVDEFGGANQYGEGHSFGEIYKEEISVSYKNREKQASEIGNDGIHEPMHNTYNGAVALDKLDGHMEIEEAEHKMVSWNN